MSQGYLTFQWTPSTDPDYRYERVGIFGADGYQQECYPDDPDQNYCRLFVGPIGEYTWYVDSCKGTQHGTYGCWGYDPTYATFTTEYNPEMEPENPDEIAYPYRDPNRPRHPIAPVDWIDATGHFGYNKIRWTKAATLEDEVSTVIYSVWRNTAHTTDGGQVLGQVTEHAPFEAVVLEFIDQTALPGVTYYYGIEADNLYTYMPPATFDTAVAFTIPGAPEALTLTPLGTDSMLVGWNPPAFDGAKPILGYEIRRVDLGMPFDVLRVSMGTVMGGATSFTDHYFLRPGAKYEYQVSAINFAGTGPASAAAAAFTKPGVEGGMRFPPDARPTCGASTTPCPVNTLGWTDTAIYAEEGVEFTINWGNLNRHGAIKNDAGGSPTYWMHLEFDVGNEMPETPDTYHGTTVAVAGLEVYLEGIGWVFAGMPTVSGTLHYTDSQYQRYWTMTIDDLELNLDATGMGQMDLANGRPAFAEETKFRLVPAATAPGNQPWQLILKEAQAQLAGGRVVLVHGFMPTAFGEPYFTGRDDFNEMGMLADLSRAGFGQDPWSWSHADGTALTVAAWHEGSAPEATSPLLRRGFSGRTGAELTAGRLVLDLETHLESDILLADGTTGTISGPYDLVGYSFGGLITRWAVEQEMGSASVPQTDLVSSLVTLATPHYGSYAARPFIGWAAQQCEDPSNGCNDEIYYWNGANDDWVARNEWGRLQRGMPPLVVRDWHANNAFRTDTHPHTDVARGLEHQRVNVKSDFQLQNPWFYNPLQDKLAMEEWRASEVPYLFLGAKEHDEWPTGMMIVPLDSQLRRGSWMGVEEGPDIPGHCSHDVGGVESHMGVPKDPRFLVSTAWHIAGLPCPGSGALAYGLSTSAIGPGTAWHAESIVPIEATNLPAVGALPAAPWGYNWTMDSSMSKASVNLIGPRPIPETLRVTDPYGGVHTFPYSDAVVQWRVQPTLQGLSVTFDVEAIEGNWQVRINQPQFPTILMQILTNVTVEDQTSPSNGLGQFTHFQVEVNGDTPVLGLAPTAAVASLDGVVSSYVLVDDGTRGDEVASDGVYSRDVLLLTAEVHPYRIFIADTIWRTLEGDVDVFLWNDVLRRECAALAEEVQPLGGRLDEYIAVGYRCITGEAPPISVCPVGSNAHSLKSFDAPISGNACILEHADTACIILQSNVTAVPSACAGLDGADVGTCWSVTHANPADATFCGQRDFAWCVRFADHDSGCVASLNMQVFYCTGTLESISPLTCAPTSHTGDLAGLCTPAGSAWEMCRPQVHAGVCITATGCPAVITNKCTETVVGTRCV